MTGTFVGFVDDAGKFSLDYPRQFQAFAARFKGEECEIEFRKRRTKRSDKQNRAFHACITPVGARRRPQHRRSEG